MEIDFGIRRNLLQLLIVVFGCFFLCCGCSSYPDMVYLIRGRTTQAVILRVDEVTKDYFGRKIVEYEFTDSEGNVRSDSDTVSSDWKYPPTGTLSVVYTPGEDGKSRLSGHIAWFPVTIFVLLLIILGVLVFRFLMEARKATHTIRPGRKRMKD